jgi:hypothetical protein
MAPTVGAEVTPIGVHDAGEIERGIGELARMSNAELIVIGSTRTVVHRRLIIALAARYQLPAIYYERSLQRTGAYSPMGQVFWISIGVRPGMSMALRLTVPPLLLARADEVIE